MGRRVKQPAAVHRQTIAQAAEELFRQKGVAATTMAEIAQAAGYSKATLYVYFQNKEEIVGALALKSMKLLQTYLTAAVEQQADTKTRYTAVCRALASYQRQYPAYFELALGRLKGERPGCLPVEQETFAVGEEINRLLARFVAEGQQAGALRPDLAVLSTVFVFWGSLSGLVLLAAQKGEYLQQALGQSGEEFLEQGFVLLYRSIAKEAD